MPTVQGPIHGLARVARTTLGVSVPGHRSAGVPRHARGRCKDTVCRNGIFRKRVSPMGRRYPKIPQARTHQTMQRNPRQPSVAPELRRSNGGALRANMEKLSWWRKNRQKPSKRLRTSWEPPLVTRVADALRRYRARVFNNSPGYVSHRNLDIDGIHLR